VVGLPAGCLAEVGPRIAASLWPWHLTTFPGLLGNVVAGRIANRLTLGGTNAVTGAACARSTVAGHTGRCNSPPSAPTA